MWILPLIGYLGIVIGFAFLTLSIASGLYYLSELVEEHTVISKKLLYRLIYTVISLHALLCIIDRLPASLCLLSIISHLIYSSNLRRFPLVKLTDPLFLLSCLLVVINHWLWFRHFANPLALHNRQSYYGDTGAGYYYDPLSSPDLPTFTEIASYFGLCVWLVPFALFVSLSAGENVLPSMGTEIPSASADAASIRSEGLGAVAGRRYKNKGMAKALVDQARDWMRETSQLMGLQRGEKIHDV